MHKLRIAEWILALAMTRERAEAIAGDLSESGRGSLWFWRSVLATMVASVWSDFRSAPWRLIVVALGVTVVVGAEEIMSWFVFKGFQPHQLITPKMILVLAGWSIAQFSGRREIASWLTAALLWSVIDLILIQITPHVGWLPWPPVEALSLTLLGAISARVRPRLLSSN